MSVETGLIMICITRCCIVGAPSTAPRAHEEFSIFCCSSSSKTLPKSRAVGEDWEPRVTLSPRQEAMPHPWACSVVATGRPFPNFLFKFQYHSILLSPCYLMGPYIRTYCITLLFCYGTFKWESFFNPSCLTIKCVKST